MKKNWLSCFIFPFIFPLIVLAQINVQQIPAKANNDNPKNGKAKAKNDTSRILNELASKLDTFVLNHPVEKVYLHLNKNHYELTDTIWYKAYVVSGIGHRLSGLSNVLYVELSGSGDSVITRQIVHLEQGLSWNNIILPASIKPGDYLLRAYTNWMRNDDQHYFFNQKINIGGVTSAITGRKSVVFKNPAVQFFPEGGDMVYGLRSRIAVKVVGTDGLGQDLLGVITDDTGNSITEFETRHLGMGAFAITPQKGRYYKAKITIAGRDSFYVDLPKPLATGFTLGINNNLEDSILLKVSVAEDILKERTGSSFFLIGQNGGKVYYTASAILAGNVFTASIEKSRFPSGITQFTLFSATGEPMAERVIFLQNSDTVAMKTSTIDSVYKTRQKVALNVMTKSNLDKPVVGTFSVSVVNENRSGLDDGEEGSILSHLLLTSEIKGVIEKPDYYFKTINRQTQSDLDLLMLTQGYRRFEWTKISTGDKSNPHYLPEKGLTLTGTIKTNSGKPVANGRVTLVSTLNFLSTDTTTDVNGNFQFTELNLPDTGKILISAKNEKGKGNVSIFIKSPDFPTITNPPNNIRPKKSQADDGSLPSSGARQLNVVTINGHKIAKADPDNKYGTEEERIITAKNLYGYTSIKAALLATQRNVILAYHPGFLMDGVPFSLNDMAAFSMEEMDRVSIIYDSRTLKPGIFKFISKKAAGTDTVVLKTVVIGAKKTNKSGNSSNLNGHWQADQVIKGERLEACIRLSDCLAGKLFGVTFSSNGIPYNSRAGSRQVPMAIIIDGNVLDGSALNNLSGSDIESIEVLRSGGNLAMYGSSAAGGALLINTKRGAVSSYITSETPSGIITYAFRGYHKAREFYIPQYTINNINNVDRRNSVYWNPNVITDSNGNIHFEYFNNDTRGTYRITIEGIDINGNLGRHILRYRVE